MQIIGHRGAKGLAPENTLASIEQALNYHVDMIEIDLRTTKDGRVILAHDPRIGQREIARATFAQLQAINTQLTLLSEAFSKIPQDKPVNLEIKPYANVNAIASVIQAELLNGRKAHNLMLSSFHFPTLQAVHAKMPDIPVAILEKYFGLRAASRARRIGTNRIHMASWNLWSGYIRAATHAGFEVYAFTVNDRPLAQKWQKAGLKGIFTDYPDRFTQEPED